MGKNKFLVSACRLLVMAILLSLAGSASSQDDDVRRKQWEDDANRSLREANRKIEFFGKVVDEDGNPLAGVNVEVGIRRNDPRTLIKDLDLQRTTDQHGLFSVLNETGTTVIISQLELKGYQNRTDNYRGFIYDEERITEEEERPPTRDNPAVFVLRKIGTAAPLLKGECNGILTADSAYHEMPLFKKYQLRPVLGKNYLNYKMPTIQAKWKITEDDKQWLISVKGKHEGDIVLISDQLLYEAPASGYLPEAEIAITVPSPPAWGIDKDVYIYLQTAKPVTYTRLETEIRTQIRPSNEARLYVKSFTNPYGTRFLEQAPNDSLYGGFARYNFEDEAIRALARGENPRLPTEQELLEFKAKQEKEEAEKAAIIAEQLKKIREDERKQKR